MSKKILSDFVSVFDFEKQTGVSRQKIYRLIREGKIPPENVRLEERIVMRLRISRNTVI